MTVSMVRNRGPYIWHGHVFSCSAVLVKYIVVSLAAADSVKME
jgi:hypothetical protein